MSAIAGVFWFDSAPAKSGHIQRLTSAMAAQGPDGQTSWTHLSVSLGHCMLKTTAESVEESQPVISANKNLALVWDGRLDNRSELIRELVQAGNPPRNLSDAELAFQSYVRWGQDCCKHFAGDFALAIWDARTQQLFCARDHMGARPFYYTSTREFFAFASEDEALLTLPGVSGQANEQYIASYLVPDLRQQDFTQTSLAGVYTLPPAYRLRAARDGEIHSETYWSFTVGEESSYSSDIECQEAFLEVFGQAVRRRLRSRGDVAAMVSGGMDSASLTAMAKQILPEFPGKEFHSYSAVSDDPASCVETRCILQLTEDLGKNAHYLSVPSFTGMLNVEDLLSVCWSKPHPVNNSILLPAMMCLAASRDGHRVMLHGMGGDYTMGVHDRYIGYMLQKHQWAASLGECQALSKRYDNGNGLATLHYLAQNAWTAFGPRTLKSMLFQWRQRNAESPLANSHVNPEFARKLGITDRIRDFQRDVAVAELHPQKDQIRYISPPYGYVLGLNGFNRVAARFGIELRDPWSDKDLAEFWLRLPVKYKARNGWRKYLARTAFEGHLDSSVVWRRGKQHLGWEFTARMVKDSAPWASQEMSRLQPEFSEFLNTLHPVTWLNGEETENDDCAWHTPYDILVLTLWLERIRRINLTGNQEFLDSRSK